MSHCTQDEGEMAWVASGILASRPYLLGHLPSIPSPWWPTSTAPSLHGSPACCVSLSSWVLECSDASVAGSVLYSSSGPMEHPLNSHLMGLPAPLPSDLLFPHDLQGYLLASNFFICWLVNCLSLPRKLYEVRDLICQLWCIPEV